MLLRRPMAAVLALLVLAAGTAHARGQLQTRQTGVDLPAGTRAGRLVLANTGDAPIAAQIRVYAWRQEGGEDVLEPTSALVVSPAIVEIPANGEHLVRVVRPDGSAVAHEQAYRVVVDELPGDPADDSSTVQVRMRFLIPVFVRAADPAPAALVCRLEPSALACSNSGGRAAQLGATHLSNGAQRFEVTPGLLGYVLAGGMRRFAIDANTLAKAGPQSRLEVRLNGEPATLDLARAP